jgi:hypothetical protein
VQVLIGPIIQDEGCEQQRVFAAKEALVAFKLKSYSMERNKDSDPSSRVRCLARLALPLLSDSS